MAAMKLKVQLIIESDSGETEVMQEVAELGSSQNLFQNVR